jgi:hypothetical protein
MKALMNPATIMTPLILLGCGWTMACSGGSAGTRYVERPKDAGHSEPDTMALGDSIAPPAAPPDAATTSTATTNFAIHQLFFGDTDFSGAPQPNAWEELGYNVDGMITTAATTNVCTLVDGGGFYGRQNQVDGKGGIDNSFGAIFYRWILLSLDSAVTRENTVSIAAGRTNGDDRRHRTVGIRDANGQRAHRSSFRRCAFPRYPHLDDYRRLARNR